MTESDFDRLDDFQDGSSLRRGQPSAHTIFGAPQTINSSNYMVMKALQQIQLSSGEKCAEKALGKLADRVFKLSPCSQFRYLDLILVLFQGQALDIHWTYNSICPSLEEYLDMIDSSKLGPVSITMINISHPHTSTSADKPPALVETGALFTLAFELIMSHSAVPLGNDALNNIQSMTTVLGRYFQVRDDYKNLASVDVSLMGHPKINTFRYADSTCEI